jgi:hypothetical protein
MSSRLPINQGFEMIDIKVAGLIDIVYLLARSDQQSSPFFFSSPFIPSLFTFLPIIFFKIAQVAIILSI